MNAIFLEQKTDPKVIEALRAAAQRRLSPNERLEQSISFIFSSMDPKSSMTKERIREILGNTASL
ncbi:MAG: hypothetical protein NVV73_09815 [Cellvibrionaceae bacterium]|nr:hypothetical protein [Cellvibrionaceae bacterium]